MLLAAANSIGQFSFEQRDMINLKPVRLFHNGEELFGQKYLLTAPFTAGLRYSGLLRSNSLGSRGKKPLCLRQHLFEHRASMGRHNRHLRTTR